MRINISVALFSALAMWTLVSCDQDQPRSCTLASCSNEIYIDLGEGFENSYELEMTVDDVYVSGTCKPTGGGLPAVGDRQQM